ncbi:MAG: branched-chain amino acid aminotransferase [Thermoleophilaceae bacterium]|nr:branched-chain amino acid aminotransferase [Thermoleophilaceae bacterium]
MASSEAMVPATDEGFLRGDGAFEVIRVYDGRPFALAEHLDRLEVSAAGLLMDPVPRAEFEREAAELLEARGGPAFDGVLRLVLTREGRRMLFTEPLPGRSGAMRLGSVTYAPTRVLDGLKTLSYAANMLAGRLARSRGFDEALLVSPHGRVLEAPTASIFWVDSGGTICTPPLDDHILASITRQRILDLVEVNQCNGTLDDLGSATEVFLASTTREAQPVSAIDDHTFPELGEQTAHVAQELRANIQAELAG